MTFESKARLYSVNDRISAHERLRRASRALARAVEEQRQVVAEFQGNLNALDETFSNIGDTISRTHDSLGDALASLRKN